jgi:hypothetical protein
MTAYCSNDELKIKNFKWLVLLYRYPVLSAAMKSALSICRRITRNYWVFPGGVPNAGAV